jgi:hypothetical protein
MDISLSQDREQESHCTGAGADRFCCGNRPATIAPRPCASQVEVTYEPAIVFWGPGSTGAVA